MAQKFAFNVYQLQYWLEQSFYYGILNRWHNCLLIYWRTSCL